MGHMATEAPLADHHLRTVQRFIAVDAVGPNALRRQGKGVLAASHAYMSAMALRRIPHESEPAFQSWLDQCTADLCKGYGLQTPPFGTARKAINLFLRGVTFNHYLRQAYRLDEIEAFLEVPVDSLVGKALRDRAPEGCDIPVWRTLKGLTRDENAQYQAGAQRLAESWGLPARIFVDAVLWLENR